MFVTQIYFERSVRIVVDAEGMIVVHGSFRPENGPAGKRLIIAHRTSGAHDLMKVLSECTKEQLIRSVRDRTEAVSEWAAEATVNITNHLEELQARLAEAEDDHEARDLIVDSLPDADEMYQFRSMISQFKKGLKGESAAEAITVLYIDHTDVLQWIWE